MAEVKSDAVLESIINRQPFSYDPMTDGAYQAYKQEYQALGEQTKSDVLGDIGTLYGGSVPDYAQIASQQGQNMYLQQMGNLIPALEEAAYKRWIGQQEQDQMNYSLLKDKEDTEYSRGRDTVADKQFKSEADWERKKYNKEYDYQAKRDKVSDNQWNKEFNWQKTMDNREYELDKLQAAKSRSSGSGGSYRSGYVGSNGSAGTGSEDDFKKLWRQTNEKSNGRRVPGQNERTGDTYSANYGGGKTSGTSAANIIKKIAEEADKKRK